MDVSRMTAIAYKGSCNITFCKNLDKKKFIGTTVTDEQSGLVCILFIPSFREKFSGLSRHDWWSLA